MSRSLPYVWLLLLGAAQSSLSAPESAGVRSSAMQKLSQSEGFWRDASSEPPAERLSVHQLFAHALTVAAAGGPYERFDTLLSLAETCQDQVPGSGTFGNFRWYYGRAEIVDLNAVEFCMENASVLWIQYGDTLPDGVRPRLRALLDRSLGRLHAAQRSPILHQHRPDERGEPHSAGARAGAPRRPRPRARPA
jgi:hypothetical protein